MIDATQTSPAPPSLSRIASISANCLIVLALAACARNPPAAEVESIDARVSRVLQQTPLVDGHNDLNIHYQACSKGCPRGYDAYDIGATVSGHTDLPRWKQGGVGAQLLNSGWRASEPGVDGTL